MIFPFCSISESIVSHSRICSSLPSKVKIKSLKGTIYKIYEDSPFQDVRITLTFLSEQNLFFKSDFSKMQQKETQKIVIFQERKPTISQLYLNFLYLIFFIKKSKFGINFFCNISSKDI